MSKELEALNKIQHDFGQLKGQELVKCYETIFNGLKRLESIDNANPSEAFECVDYVENKLGGLRYECERTNNHRCDDLFIQEHIFTTIKQALLKAQEQEKVLDIIKKKRVDIESFYKTFIEDDFNYLDYQIMYGTYGLELLTKEEFDLLKRWLG